MTFNIMRMNNFPRPYSNSNFEIIQNLSSKKYIQNIWSIVAGMTDLFEKWFECQNQKGHIEMTYHLPDVAFKDVSHTLMIF